MRKEVVCNNNNLISIIIIINTQMSKNNTETVKVMVRVRPMNKKEYSLGSKQIVQVNKPTNQIIL